ncbi:amidase [Pseudomonas sp. GM49]|uniref:amidase n=1 Tax=Pseudomonas sp. GM49 TaxID=1144331 RepID=UPI0015A5CCC2|nr:amidase [Pseudomonas sp. GM49]
MAHSLGIKPISSLVNDIATGWTSSVQLVSDALERIERHLHDGGCAYVDVDREAAMRAARTSDMDRAAGRELSPLAGLPISIKDLFDVRGQVTTAGSSLLAQAPPALDDAFAVARLRAAGAVMLGRTNMSEFAFSGLGLNPHYGTPVNPYDNDRIAGGSSSGAAVSVALDMAVAGLGTDTGGSLRIPAAFCALVGFKPTASRVPTLGTLPLAESLDSIGAIAHSVADCILLDQVLSGQLLDTRPANLRGLRVAVTRDFVLDNLDREVGAAFERVLKLLNDAGAVIHWFDFSELCELPSINESGGLTAAESWNFHQHWLQSELDTRYDPRVAQRIRRGASLSAADYLELIGHRRRLSEEAKARLSDFDVWLMPTVACTAPLLKELEKNDELFFATNALVLRNTSVINFIDGCAISVPCHLPGELAIGLSICGLNGHDARVLQAARSIEVLLSEYLSVPH